MNIKKLLSGSLKLVLAIIFSLFSSLFNLAFADSITDTANYLPGGQYRMFGQGRGSVANLSNNIRMQGGLSQQAGNLAIETRIYRGNLSYTQEFNNHSWKEHSPFATYAHQDFHNKKGKIANGGGATLTDLSVSGYKIHPADGYDGEQGGGYPDPTGARDIYSYAVNGKEVSIRVINPDKLPPKANDDKLLKNIGIDPKQYEKTQSTPADRPTFERLTLVETNADGGLTGYNGGTENGSADTSLNGNGWNGAEQPLPHDNHYYGDNDSGNPYNVNPYQVNLSSVITQNGGDTNGDVSGSVSGGGSFVAMAGIGIEGDVSINSDGSITVSGDILAGPSVMAGVSGNVEVSVGQGTTNGIYAEGCGTGRALAGGTVCGGFSSNGGLYTSGSGGVGAQLGGGIYGKIGYAKTFNNPNKQKDN